MMHLNRQIANSSQGKDAKQGYDKLFALPEKVLQFGTGVLLRGLPDYFIDKANRQQIFNGRVVVVKSTQTGGTDAFEEQDGLYTILERGMVDGMPSEKIMLNASISRVLSAHEDWQQILHCAADPAMQVIISNTTEIGISYLESDIYAELPVSFPGRLLAFLLERFRIFKGTPESAMVIVPTELIVDNGKKLKEIVMKLAVGKGLEDACLRWLSEENDFCNSLVDCIVPGKLPDDEYQKVSTAIGYDDKLMIMSEPYRLWAIESDRTRTKKILSFSKADNGVVIAPDISKFRELKLRLLNATHTLSCALAHLAGFKTVKEAMANEIFCDFISGLMQSEIAPLIAHGDISFDEAKQFSVQVIDRFKNPFIEHLWLSISMQYTSKMNMRVWPLVEKYLKQMGKPPIYMSLGIAAYLRFMHSVKNDKGIYIGVINGLNYPVNDDKAAILSELWQTGKPENIVASALGNQQIFEKDLSNHCGFKELVNKDLHLLIENGVMNTLELIFIKK